MRCTQGIVAALNVTHVFNDAFKILSKCRGISATQFYTGRQKTIGGCGHSLLPLLCAPLFQLPQKSPVEPSFAFHLDDMEITIRSRSYMIESVSRVGCHHCYQKCYLRLERPKAIGNVSGTEDFSAASRLRSRHVPKVPLHM